MFTEKIQSEVASHLADMLTAMNTSKVVTYEVLPSGNRILQSDTVGRCRSYTITEATRKIMRRAARHTAKEGTDEQYHAI